MHVMVVIYMYYFNINLSSFRGFVMRPLNRTNIKRIYKKKKKKTHDRSTLLVLSIGNLLD